MKIITGIRRCGKSTLDLFRKYLLDPGVEDERTIHMNMESF
ncbi:MAG: AAA family ATPase [Lactobacillales bacterium]|nr:AAA family ATPase [Lactobacillales bacterium]